MSEPTVAVEFTIRTRKAVYTVEEARLEVANLQVALEDIVSKNEAIAAAKEAPATESEVANE